jgi:hypothetical protein
MVWFPSMITQLLLNTTRILQAITDLAVLQFQLFKNIVAECASSRRRNVRSACRVRAHQRAGDGQYTRDDYSRYTSRSSQRTLLYIAEEVVNPYDTSPARPTARQGEHSLERPSAHESLPPPTSTSTYSCPDDYRPCSSGHCLETYRWCDGRPDCPGGYDERECDEGDQGSLIDKDIDKYSTMHRNDNISNTTYNRRPTRHAHVRR